MQISLACKVGALLSALVLTAACASTDYGQRDAGVRPDDQSTTEASLWYQMDEAERKLRTSGSVLEDEEINAFVREAMCRVSGEYCGDLNLYIVSAPTANAFMAPNGMSVVYTGMLLRLEDESQLAAVLSHEFVHFMENHSLEMRAALSNARVYGAVIGSAIGIVGGGSLASLGDLAAAGQAMSFSRDRETEADFLGLRYMAEAGYNADSSVAVWQNLLSEKEASEFEKSRNAGKTQFFSTHPGIEERISELDLQSAAYDVVETDPVSYRAIIRPYLQSWLEAEVTLRDHSATLQLIDRLSALELDLGVLDYARGRVYALREEEGDQDAALDAFASSTGHVDAPAEAWRGLAEIYREQGQGGKAADAFERYLEKKPDARDAALVQRIIENLRGEVS